MTPSVTMRLHPMEYVFVNRHVNGVRFFHGHWYVFLHRYRHVFLYWDRYHLFHGKWNLLLDWNGHGLHHGNCNWLCNWYVNWIGLWYSYGDWMWNSYGHWLSNRYSCSSVKSFLIKQLFEEILRRWIRFHDVHLVCVNYRILYIRIIEDESLIKVWIVAESMRLIEHFVNLRLWFNAYLVSRWQLTSAF